MDPSKFIEWLWGISQTEQLDAIKEWLLSGTWQAQLVLSLILLILITGTVLKGAKFVLKSFIELRDQWTASGLPVMGRSQEQKEAIEQRKKFCKVLRSDIDHLNKVENWNDQSFTDLEAEVEAEGKYYVNWWDKLLRRESEGLRRVPSLMKAIEQSVEQHLHVVGEPGSGKSVALRHLAWELADRATRSSHAKAPVPLYINLKELLPPSLESLTPDYIKTFIINQVRRGDPDTAAFVKEHWDSNRKEGIWFFLLDSFDEIPAVMHAPTGTAIIRQYSEAIRQFLVSMDSCRGIIASREYKGPEALPWHVLRILPMDWNRQLQLMKRAFLSSAQAALVRNYLIEQGDSQPKNPMMLALLCRHVKEVGRAPVNDHALIERHIERLTSREAEFIEERYHLTQAQLLEGATIIAQRMAQDATLSLAPTQDQLANAIASHEIPGGSVSTLLSALVEIKVARSDVPESRSGERRFSFSHRRYQEALFVRYLVAHPETISPRELLSDERWREYAVTMLQSQPIETLAPLLLELEHILLQEAANQETTTTAVQPGFGDNLFFYEWTSLEHVLLIITEGLIERRSEVPAALSEALKQVLAPRWENGDLFDRRNVIIYGGLLPLELWLTYLEWAVETDVESIKEVAFIQSALLPEIPQKIQQWIRLRFALQVLYMKEQHKLMYLDALAARIPAHVGVHPTIRWAQQFRRLGAPVHTIVDPGLWSGKVEAPWILLFPEIKESPETSGIIFGVISLLLAPLFAFIVASVPLYWLVGMVGISLPVVLMIIVPVSTLLFAVVLASFMALLVNGSPLSLGKLFTDASTKSLLIDTVRLAVLPGLLTLGLAYVLPPLATWVFFRFIIRSPLEWYWCLLSIPALNMAFSAHLFIRHSRRKRHNEADYQSLSKRALPLEKESLATNSAQQLCDRLEAHPETLLPTLAHSRSLGRLLLLPPDATERNLFPWMKELGKQGSNSWRRLATLLLTRIENLSHQDEVEAVSSDVPARLADE